MSKPANYPQVKDLIDTKAIALRLKAGSDEAGYLAQIFPLPKTPTVVIMKHGELKEYIAAGTAKDEFLRRLSGAFSAGSAPAPAHAQSTPAQTSSGASAIATPNAAESSAAPTTIPSGSPEADGSENVRRILAERAARAQKEAAARQAKEAEAAAAAKAAKQAKGKERAAPEPAPVPTKTEVQREAEELLKKKKAQQNDERRRILKRIEDDKEARRAQAVLREKQRQEDRAAEQTEEQDKHQAMAASRSASSASSVAAIQVRLSDGSTLRNKFPAAVSVKDIREWVDKERSDGTGPYYFKQILTPLPNKNIDTTEEHKSLRELGLSPSATLLLIPIQRFAAAYEGQAASEGFFGQVFALILGFFTWLVSLMGFGGDGQAETQTSGDNQPPANSPAALRNQRVRAFNNPDDRRGDQQLYNGNSVSVHHLLQCHKCKTLTCHS